MGKVSVEASLRSKALRLPSRITTLLYILVCIFSYHFLRPKEANSHPASADTFAKYIESQKQTTHVTGADKWSHSSLTIHVDAGPECLQKWFKVGQFCNATSFVHPPLDLVWLWHNARY